MKKKQSKSKPAKPVQDNRSEYDKLVDEAVSKGSGQIFYQGNWISIM